MMQPWPRMRMSEASAGVTRQRVWARASDQRQRTRREQWMKQWRKLGDGRATARASPQRGSALREPKS